MKKFLRQLSSVRNRKHKRNMLIVAGDWNAGRGLQYASRLHILGKFDLSQRCENGNRLTNLSDSNRVYITNTGFRHFRKHLTRSSSKSRTTDQMDCMLTWSQWISPTEDCRSHRGAEAGSRRGLYHVLLFVKLRLWLAACIEATPLRC